MTKLDILKYAYGMALEVWSREYDKMQEDNSDYRRMRLEQANARFEEIRSLLYAEEQKQKEKKEPTPSNRLTRWNGKKWVLPQGKTSDGESYFRIIAERLAAYENTGLEPEDVLKLKEEK